MSPQDMEGYLVKVWEELGLQGAKVIDGELRWVDFCVVESLFGGPTLPCDWLEFDRMERCVFLSGHPMGSIIGPNKG